MVDLSALAWPLARTGEAVEELASRSRFPFRAGTLTPVPPSADVDPERWIDAVASWLGLEAEPVDAPEADLPELLRRSAPALLTLAAARSVLVVVGAARGRVLLLSPERRVESVDVETLRVALCGDVDVLAVAAIEASLVAMSLTPSQQSRARDALLRERLRGKRVGGCSLLRLPVSSSFAAQTLRAGLAGRAVSLILAHGAQLGIGIGGWVVLGRGALEGRFERGWLIAWALLLLTAIPLRLLALWLQGGLAIGLGELLKRRLLDGALRLDPAIVRREGAGQLLGRVLESGSIESMTLNTGIGALLAMVEIAVVLAVLVGAGGSWQALVLACWVGVAMLLGARAYRGSLHWTEARRRLTHGLVEQMVGHRTRLAQADPATWHHGEDEAVEQYLTLSRRVDGWELLLQTLPYAWMITGILGFVPRFVSRDSSAEMAIGLGCVLLGTAALARLTSGVMPAVSAAVGWREVGPLFVASGVPRAPTPPTIAVLDPFASAGDTPLLSATGLGFSYPGRSEPVLDNASLRIDRGDRLLLEGPSGGGKSTLAALLSGLRAPTAGLLLVNGLDQPTLGTEGWRRRVAAAPQYHDNHIFSETLAFNLLFGRCWPPRREDFIEALAVCRELGLGDLLDRMPSGIFQMVGETGWRLSHGERSRVFIARALLQRGPLVILDESFAALDPKTLERCLRCVIERAPALLVIAHP